MWKVFDKLISLTSQVIYHIKGVKMASWGTHFFEKIMLIR